MATLPARPVAMPTRDELRGVSRWVWLLLALAGAMPIVAILSASELSLFVISGAVLSAGPFLVAASLMAVAPGQRLVALSAFGFAASPALRLVQLIFSADIHDLLRMSLTGYLDLAERVQAAVGVARGLDWLFDLVAILCLAFYIGTVRSQRGWWIVGIGLALAAVHVIVNVATLWPFWSAMAESPDAGFEPVRQAVLTVLGPLDLVAWGYLAAVCVERRMAFIALAGGLRLIESAVGLLGVVAAQAFPPPLAPREGDVFNLGWVSIYPAFYLAFFALLIFGILSELPRDRIRPAAAATPTEATGTGR